MSETVQEWLLKIAEAVESWEKMRKDDVEVWLVTLTPSGAVTYIVDKHVPAAYREAVRKALPILTTDDFPAAPGTSTLCFSPPDSLVGLRSRRCVSCTPMSSLVL